MISILEHIGRRIDNESTGLTESDSVNPAIRCHIRRAPERPAVGKGAAPSRHPSPQNASNPAAQQKPESRDSEADRDTYPKTEWRPKSRTTLSRKAQRTYLASLPEEPPRTHAQTRRSSGEFRAHPPTDMDKAGTGCPSTPTRCRPCPTRRTGWRRPGTARPASCHRRYRRNCTVPSSVAHCPTDRSGRRSRVRLSPTRPRSGAGWPCRTPGSTTGRTPPHPARRR